MYKLMIVDDEYSTRNGLKICIDWFNYGIEVVGEAENGIRGLELADRVRPDIVLTDVKMPGMDGIEKVSSSASGKARNPNRIKCRCVL